MLKVLKTRPGTRILFADPLEQSCQPTRFQEITRITYRDVRRVRQREHRDKNVRLKAAKVLMAVQMVRQAANEFDKPRELGRHLAPHVVRAEALHGVQQPGSRKET